MLYRMPHHIPDKVELIPEEEENLRSMDRITQVVYLATMHTGLPMQRFVADFFSRNYQYGLPLLTREMADPSAVKANWMEDLLPFADCPPTFVRGLEECLKGERRIGHYLPSWAARDEF